jgi:phage terminase large subunit-like protein
MAWDLSCPDWQDRIRQGRSLLPELPLITSEANRAVAIFNRLQLPDVPGTPTMEKAAGEWQRDLVRALFGSYDPGKNERYIRELLCLVPKKNSKTTGGAAIMLTAMLMSRRPRAEYLLVAPTLEIADLAFSQAVGMIEADPVLSAKCQIQSHIKRIRYRPTGCFLKVKSFDPKVVTGSKPAGVLLDEVHVIAEAHDADRVIGQLRGGLISQPEAFIAMITTQSERPPAGVFKAELAKARAVRDGTLKDAAVLPLLYEFPPDVNWRDPANWKMVTPNHGLSITVERLIPDYEKAVVAGEDELRRWASQHLNVEIGLALRADRWTGAEFWEACVEKVLDLDELLERSEVCVTGIDGGGLDDLLGLNVLGRCRETRRWLSWSHAWAHKIVLERRKEIAPRLLDFAAAGELTIVDTPGQDVEEVADHVCRIKDAGLLPEKNAIGVDAAGIGDIVDALTDPSRGDPEEMQSLIVAVQQGWRLNGAIKTVERKLAGGELAHGPSGLMDWCVSNARIELKGNAVTITKAASGTAKIDPVMALFNSATLMSLNPVASGGVSFWETEAA